MCVHLSAGRSVGISLCLSVCLCLCLPVCLCLCLSVSLSLSLSLSLCLSLCRVPVLFGGGKGEGMRVVDVDQFRLLFKSMDGMDAGKK